jgi:hypothetical protein
MGTLPPPRPAVDRSTHLYCQLLYTLTDLLPRPLDDTPAALRARNPDMGDKRCGKREAIEGAASEDAWALHVAERSVLLAADPDASPMEAERRAGRGAEGLCGPQGLGTMSQKQDKSSGRGF